MRFYSASEVLSCIGRLQTLQIQCLLSSRHPAAGDVQIMPTDFRISKLYLSGIAC